jgi:hypothetical protein
LISKRSSKDEQVTLDQFIPKPLTFRTEKFIRLCDFYTSINGEHPSCPYDIYNFVQEHKLPNDIKLFKFLPLRSIASYYWKWGSIEGERGKND